MEVRTTNPEAVLISDTLSEAAAQIRHYLHDPIWSGTYIEPVLLRRIQTLLAEMDAVRAELDTPPPFRSHPQRIHPVQ